MKTGTTECAILHDEGCNENFQSLNTDFDPYTVFDGDYINLSGNWSTLDNKISCLQVSLCFSLCLSRK